MNNTTGKKILHGICGAIIGAIAGVVIMLDSVESNSALVLPAVGGAVILGALAFFRIHFYRDRKLRGTFMILAQNFNASKIRFYSGCDTRQ